MDLLTEKALKNNYPNSIGNYLKIFLNKSILQNYKIIKLI